MTRTLPSSPITLRTALLWSALSGFLALAWEIIWARVFNFASGSRAPVFGYMLASYLAGLALGSLWSMRWQRSSGETASARQRLSGLIVRANLLAFAIAPLTGWLAVVADWSWAYGLVLLAGASLGVVFPWVCDAAVPADVRSGSRLSYLYLVNIIGSGAGSLLTGFVLMEYLSLELLSLHVLFLACVWALAMDWLAAKQAIMKAVLPIVLVAVGFAGFRELYERLYYKHEHRLGMRFAQVHESRHGVICVDTNRVVYGNGAYDGIIETKLEPGSWLVRPYFLPAVRDRFHRVLVIGVATGAWTQILANNPAVKHITAVELSSGYLDIIARYPEVSGILSNPKVNLVIDDGRRWLRQHPDERFDAIVMNTTHHWREFASALLSREFLEQVKGHLTPEGIAFWNCTDSPRAAATGLAVFPHTMMVLNHCLASQVPLSPDRQRWQRALAAYLTTEGKPLFDLNSEAGKQGLESVLSLLDKQGLPIAPDKMKWCDRATMQAAWGKEEIITDDNLGHDYR